MKAKLIATALSFFVSIFSVHAESAKDNSVSPPPIVIQKIDINTADVTTLTGSVKGIGKKRAEAIIAYRKSHHGFKSLEELAEVKGLGQHFMTANRDKINEIFIVNQIE